VIRNEYKLNKYYEGDFSGPILWT